MASNRADDVKRRFTNIVNSPELRSRAHGRDRAASLVEQIVASCHPKQRAFVEDPSKEIAALVGRGGGKLLCSDTPIPTPAGWTRLGDICVGDGVFDESGRVEKVTAVYDGTPALAYRLTFSDGAQLDACSEHLWTTWTVLDRKALNREGTGGGFPDEWPSWRHGERGPAVRTTASVVDTLHRGPRRDRNHCIPTALPLQLPNRRLPVDPYVLGYWLGDGSRGYGVITCEPRDQPSLKLELWRVGLGWGKRSHPNTVGVHGLATRLRKAGVLNDKHVPAKYLRASVDQRLALLRGLMDSDGYASNEAKTRVEFCNTSRSLAEAVLELATSLGEKPVFKEKRAMLNGRDCGEAFLVTWSPSKLVPFLLPRKARRLKMEGAQRLRAHHRMVVGAEVIASKPMRCLTVNGRHGLFLAGRHMVPTHNTTGGRARLLKQCLTVPRSRCLYIATTRSQAERFMWGPLLQINEQLQLGCMPLISKLRIDFPNGSFIQLGGCDDRKSIEKWRGEPFHEVHIDEAATHTVQILSWLVDRIIGPRLGDYDGAIILYGTPGHILAGLFYDTTREQSELSERYEDRTEGYLGWSKHDWTLEDAVKAGVPAAISLWKRALRTKALNGWSDDHPVWRREYLGKWAADDTEGVYRYRPHLEDGTEWNQWNPEMDSMGFAKLPPGEWLYTYGFDMGHSDPFALEIFAHNSETSKLLHVYEFNQKGMKVRDIAELLVGKRWVRLILLGQDPGAAGGLIGRTGWPYGMVADIAGLGGAILDELRDVYGIPIEAADKKHKHDSIELTNGDLLDGRIKVLKGSVLEEQLMALQWAVDQWGKLKEDKGARNDACDALLYLRRKAMLLIGHEAEAERPDPKSQEALDAWESESIAQAIREEKAKDDEFGFGDMAGLEYTEYTDDW